MINELSFTAVQVEGVGYIRWIDHSQQFSYDLDTRSNLTHRLAGLCVGYYPQFGMFLGIHWSFAMVQTPRLVKNRLAQLCAEHSNLGPGF